jgi:hypothetical protein
MSSEKFSQGSHGTEISIREGVFKQKGGRTCIGIGNSGENPNRFNLERARKREREQRYSKVFCPAFSS